MPHSDEISLLAERISDIRSGRVLAELSEARAHIADQYQAFEDIMAADAPPHIYGVNTLPGHREGSFHSSGQMFDRIGRWRADLSGPLRHTA